MSSRVLSAYLDDFRKGKRQREELRQFMEDAIRKDPIRRGHFMGWLDQAQYEHPIPVTEFLLLRREIEATLDTDDETRIAPPQQPVKTAPDAETLVAGDEGATLIAPSTGDEGDATEVSSGSQPSDMARLHDVPTLIAAPGGKLPDPAPEQPEDATVVSGTHASVAATQQSAAPTPGAAQATAQPARSGKPPLIPPTWLWGSGVLISITLLLGYWALQPMTKVIRVEPAEPTVEADTPAAAALPEQPPPQDMAPASEPQPPAGEALTAAEQVPQSTPAPEANTTATSVAPPLTGLSAQQALALLQQRIGEGLLLPLDQPGNAQEVFDFMEAEHAGSAELLQARQALKDTYLAASKRAQGKAQWDDSQTLLDAAFEVLNTTAR